MVWCAPNFKSVNLRLPLMDPLPTSHRMSREATSQVSAVWGTSVPCPPDLWLVHGGRPKYRSCTAFVVDWPRRSEGHQLTPLRVTMWSMIGPCLYQSVCRPIHQNEAKHVHREQYMILGPESKVRGFRGPVAVLKTLGYLKSFID